MRILVTFALEPEFAPWRRLRRFRRLDSSWPAVFDSRLPGLDIRVILTGVGAVPARGALAAAFAPLPDVCISSGVAGGLEPGQRVGQVFAARATRELSSHRTLPADDSLFQSALHAGASPAAFFCTSQDLVVSGEGKRRLAPLGQAVEMEGFHILSEAARLAVPALAIRSLSDLADSQLPYDFAAMLDPRGRLIPSRLASAILRAPLRLPALLQLRSHTAFAAASLARVLDALVRSLASGAAGGSLPHPAHSTEVLRP